MSVGSASPAERLARHLRARGETVRVRETHGAWVVLGRELAWKIKKPIAFGPLDYSTRARRATFCRAELERNRPWAPSVYLGVVGLRPSGDALVPVAAGDGGVVEHAVVMRRYDERDTLAAAIACRGGATVDAVGRRLAAHHAAAPRVAVGGPDAVRAELDELFAGLAAEPDAPPGAAAGERTLRAFLTAATPLLAERAARGLVRTVHGDLRAEHVLLRDGEVELVDAIEFSPALARLDLAEELGFLVMDLHALGAGHLVPRLLASYRAAGGDPGPDRLVLFFAVLKAWVRARVALLRAVQHERAAARGARAEAAALARLAARLAWGVRGISVVAVGGTAATGKSTLAAALRAETRFAVLAADRERKARVGLAATARGGPELYTPAVDRAVYAALGARVAALRTRGRGAIVDATLRRERDRAAFVAAAGAEPDLWVECRAPEEVVLARAADREGAAGRVSDAGAEQAARQLAAPCALTEAAPDRWCAARTDRPAAEVVAELGALADARLAASALDAGRDDGHRHVAALADRV